MKSQPSAKERSFAERKTTLRPGRAKVNADNPLPAPVVGDSTELEPGKFVVLLPKLVTMKLMANRDQDRVHLRDMIDVGLVDRDVLSGLPEELAGRLNLLLADAGK